MRLQRAMFIAGRSFVLGIALAAAPWTTAVGQTDIEVLSNAKVIEMVNSKVPKNLILGKIRTARPGYDLSTAGIIALNTAKVDQNLILEMTSFGDQAWKRHDAPSSLTGINENMTNEVIVMLANSKLPKQLVIAKMKMSPAHYDLSSDGMIGLIQKKVPEDLIKLMQTLSRPVAVAVVDTVSPLPPPPVTVSARTGPPAVAIADSSKKSSVAPPPKASNPPPRPLAAPPRPVVDPSKRPSIAIYPLAAGSVADMYQFAVGGMQIHASIGMRVAQAFLNSRQWQVINRASDSQLAGELARTKEMTNFRSPIIVADNQQVNARYVVTGLVEQAQLKQTPGSNGCPSWEVNLRFTSEIDDVQSKTSVASNSFITGYPSMNGESWKEIGPLKAKFAIRDVMKKCKGQASDVVEFALIDVSHQVEAWAAANVPASPVK